MSKTRTVVIIAVALALVMAATYGWFQFGRQEPRPSNTVIIQTPPPGNASPDRTGSEPAADIDPGSTGARVDALIFDRFAVALDDAEEEFIRRFGRPESETDEEVPSTHEPGKMLRLRTLNYQGMSITLFKLEDRDLIQEIRVTNESYGIKYGLSVGTTEERVLNVLGDPARREGQSLIYEDKDGFAQVAFEMKDGKVAGCHWYYLID